MGDFNLHIGEVNTNDRGQANIGQTVNAKQSNSSTDIDRLILSINGAEAHWLELKDEMGKESPNLETVKRCTKALLQLANTVPAVYQPLVAYLTPKLKVLGLSLMGLLKEMVMP